jgi:hypothetical protein
MPKTLKAHLCLDRFRQDYRPTGVIYSVQKGHIGVASCEAPSDRLLGFGQVRPALQETTASLFYIRGSA